jgi:hypothetical protein
MRSANEIDDFIDFCSLVFGGPVFVQISVVRRVVCNSCRRNSHLGEAMNFVTNWQQATTQTTNAAHLTIVYQKPQRLGHFWKDRVEIGLLLGDLFVSNRQAHANMCAVGRRCAKMITEIPSTKITQCDKNKTLAKCLI